MRSYRIAGRVPMRSYRLAGWGASGKTGGWGGQKPDERVPEGGTRVAFRIPEWREFRLP